MVPKGLETATQIVVAMQLGAELGLQPLTSLQNIAVINGRPSLWGDAMLAVCRASGLFMEADFLEETVGEGDTLTAVCTVRRNGGNKTVRRFSVAMAKRAGLWGRQGPWQQYPERMLQMRARSYALRDAFSDVLKGLLTAEEVRDIPLEARAAGVTEITGSPLEILTKEISERNVSERNDAAPATPEPESAEETNNRGVPGDAPFQAAEQRNEPSYLEKLRIAVGENLEACRCINDTAKVLEAFKDTARAVEGGYEWLITACDRRAEELAKEEKKSAKKSRQGTF